MEHPGDPDLPWNDYRSTKFRYGNWNEPQMYVCKPCSENGVTRPPIGLIELSPFDESFGGEFVPLCYSHAGIEVHKWIDHFAQDDIDESYKRAATDD